jgi:hypothetical protein
MNRAIRDDQDRSLGYREISQKRPKRPDRIITAHQITGSDLLPCRVPSEQQFSGDGAFLVGKDPGHVLLST